jgi:DNA primase
MVMDRATSLVDVLYQELIPRLAIEEAYPDVDFKIRRGRYWRGGCPIHRGKDPNFSVQTETLSWSCFSHCGHGSYLAYLNGGETPRAPPTPEQAAVAHRSAVLDGYAALAADALARPEGAHVVRNLARRGFPADADALARMGFGAHPPRSQLTTALVGQPELAELGLDSQGWSGRLVIPWRDEVGRIATVVARATTDEEPRYLYLRGAARPAYFTPGRRRPRSVDTLLS